MHLIPGCCHIIHGRHVRWQDCECDEGFQHMASSPCTLQLQRANILYKTKVYKSYNLHIHCKYGTCLIMLTSKQCLVWDELPTCLVIIYALISQLKVKVSESISIHTKHPPKHKDWPLLYSFNIFYFFKNTSAMMQQKWYESVNMNIHIIMMTRIKYHLPTNIFSFSWLNVNVTVTNCC